MILVILAIAYAVFRFSHFNPQRVIIPVAKPIMEKIHQFKQANGLVALCIAVFLPSLALYLFLDFFASSTIFYLTALALLIIAFAGNNYEKHLENFIELRKNGHYKQAYDVAVHHLGVDPEKHQADSPNLYDVVNRGMIGLQFNTLFLNFFWFIVFLGHPAIVLFILLLNLFIKTSPSEPKLALNLRHALGWIPVRLAGLTFALMGDFPRCFNVWFKDLLDIQMPSRKILQEYANAALGEMLEPDEFSIKVVKLVQRSFVTWMVLFAIMITFGSIYNF